MRERFSTGIYCDFCGAGKDAQPEMIAARSPVNAHICRGCITLFAAGHTAQQDCRRETAARMNGNG